MYDLERQIDEEAQQMANVRFDLEYLHGRRITKCKDFLHGFAEENPLTVACGKCVWLRALNSNGTFTFCGYLYETGKKRDCAPGEKCIKRDERATEDAEIFSKCEGKPVPEERETAVRIDRDQ